MIRFKHKGDFSKLEKFLKRSSDGIPAMLLDRYGQAGVAALSAATPKNTGDTADGWYYRIEKEPGVLKLVFCNSNNQNGVPIAIVLQYGHATKNGGFVYGRDYINPAVQPIFDKLTEEAWEEVKRR